MSLEFKGAIDNIPALVQIVAWRRSGNKPLSEPIMVSLVTQICVTRPQLAEYLNFAYDWQLPDVHQQIYVEKQCLHRNWEILSWVLLSITSIHNTTPNSHIPTPTKTRCMRHDPFSTHSEILRNENSIQTAHACSVRLTAAHQFVPGVALE